MLGHRTKGVVTSTVVLFATVWTLWTLASLPAYPISYFFSPEDTTDEPDWYLHRNRSVAILLPLHGDKLAAWFPYWLQSCRGNPMQKGHFTIEWFVFHEGLPQLEEWQKNNSFPIPSTVRLINLHKNGIVDLFASKTARALHRNPKKQAELYRKSFEEHGGYLLTELKGLYGLVFEDYIRNFTHWSWADHDIMWGDLQAWIEESELTDFHIATYSFGDNRGVYLRGQLTLFRNTRRNNMLWTKCDLLTGDDLRPRGSDEGCLAYHILTTPGLKIKIATKQASPFDAAGVYYWVDGRLLQLRPGDILEFEQRLASIYANNRSTRSPADDTSSNYILSLFHNNNTSPQSSLSNWTRVPTLADTSKCLGWMLPQYRICISLEQDWRHNVLVEDGNVYHQSFEFPEPAAERMFIHLQAWKRLFKQVTPPPVGTKTLVFKITSQGITPIVSVPMATLPARGLVQ